MSVGAIPPARLPSTDGARSAAEIVQSYPPVADESLVDGEFVRRRLLRLATPVAHLTSWSRCRTVDLTRCSTAGLSRVDVMSGELACVCT